MDSEPVKNLFTGSFIYKDIGLCGRIVNVLLACCLTGISTMASAGVVIGGTRVVYSSDKSDATITVKNNEAAIPYLIQTWVDPFSNTGTAKKPPFTVIPPVSRLEAGQEKFCAL